MDGPTLNKTIKSQLATMEHRDEVGKGLDWIIENLLKRRRDHDLSKLEEPELSYFANSLPLSEMEFGTPEYQAGLAHIQEGVDLHRAANSHHPEFYSDGISGMTLLDLNEMFADWAAAVKRNKSGDLQKSITYCTKKYNIPLMLESILRNTARMYDSTRLE